MPKIDKRSEKQKKTAAINKRNEKRKTQPTKYAKYKDEHGKLHEEVKKLEVEQLFTNMKDLFDTLDTYLPNDGDQRSTAIRRVKRHINIENEKGNTIKIVSIYDEPIEWVDGRSGGNRSVYTQYLKSILLYSLLQEEGYSKDFSYTKFWVEMGMRNKYYSNEQIKKLLPEFDEDITGEMLDDFFYWTSSKNKNITDYILDSLADDGLISYDKYKMVKKPNERNPRKATAKERSEIGSEEKRIFTDWGYKNKQEVWLARKSRKLYKEVKHNLGYSYFDQFTVYIFDRKILENGIETCLEDCAANFDEFKQTRMALNDVIIAKDIESAQRRYDKTLKKAEKKLEELRDSFALGTPNTNMMDKYIHHLYINGDYVDNFMKPEEYFTRLNPNMAICKVLKDIEEEIERKKEEESE